MNKESFKEAVLLPLNIGGLVLAVFGVAKACYGERVPALMPLLCFVVTATSWIILRTQEINPRKVMVAGSLAFATMAVGLFLLLRGYGAAS